MGYVVVSREMVKRNIAIDKKQKENMSLKQKVVSCLKSIARKKDK